MITRRQKLYFAVRWYLRGLWPIKPHVNDLGYTVGNEPLTEADHRMAAFFKPYVDEAIDDAITAGILTKRTNQSGCGPP